MYIYYNIYIYIIYIYIILIFIYSAVDMCQNLRAKTGHLNDKSRRPNVFSACHDTGATRRGAVFKTVLP